MRRKNRKEIQIDDFLFFMAWGMFVVALILGSTILNVENLVMARILKGIRYIAYAICCVKIYHAGFKKRYFIPIILFVLSFLLSYIKSRDTTMALYMLICLAALEIDGDKIIKKTERIQGILLVLVILLSQLGIIEDYVFGVGIRPRHGLGFSWTTTGAILFFYFTLCFLYTHRRCVKIQTLIILEAINIWLFFMTDSRLAFVLLTVFLSFTALQYFNEKKWSFLRKLNWLYIGFPFLMEGFTIIVFKKYNSSDPVWTAVNSLLSERLSLGKSAIDTYGISLLGNSVEWIGFNAKRPTMALAVGYNYVDSSYLQLTIQYGVLFMVAVLAIYSYAIYKAVKSNDYELVAIYVCILVFALTEPRLMNFAYNPFPLLAFGRLGSNIATEYQIKKAKLKKINEVVEGAGK